MYFDIFGQDMLAEEVEVKHKQIEVKQKQIEGF